MRDEEFIYLFDFFGDDFASHSIGDCISAAENGSAKEQAFLALCYRFGLEGLEEDSKKAVMLAKKSAKQNCPEGLKVLGDFYYDGYGMISDNKKAFDCYQKANKYGGESRIALLSLGKSYLYGIGIPCDRKKGGQLLWSAVEKKSWEACIIIVKYYMQDRNDLDITIDDNDKDLLRKTLDLGNNWGILYCQTYLGISYLEGIIFPENPKKAFKIIKKTAIEHNYGMAFAILAKLYAKGIGVKENLDLAEKCIIKAKENGYEDDSMKTLEDYYEESNKDDIGEIIINENAKGAINYKSNKELVPNYVVFIETKEGNRNYSGTGFIIDAQGYIATCAHVVENAEKIFVKVNELNDSKNVHPASLIKMNKKTDVAIIKIIDDVQNLFYAEIDKDRKQPVLAEEISLYGYPMGYQLNDNVINLNISVTKGIVASNQIKDGIRKTMLDIKACHGNSGSPVISRENGKVIGLLSGGIQGENVDEVNYMIPVCYLRELITKITDTGKKEEKKDNGESATLKKTKKSQNEEKVPKKNENSSSDKVIAAQNFKTWAEVKRFLRNKYGTAEENNDCLAFDFELNDGRTQCVYIELKTSENNASQWVCVSSCIGLIDESEINDVLAEINDWCFGGLVFEKEFNKHFIRYSQLLCCTTEQSLIGPIEAIAIMADEFEEKYIGGDQN